MSRIGKKEITIPKDVDVSIIGNKVIIKGSQGILEQTILEGISIKLEVEKIALTCEDESKKARAFHGLLRALVQNMVLGVSQKFRKTLLVDGVGYKFQLDNKMLLLNMGFSHPVEFVIPEGIVLKLEIPTKLLIEGIEKQKVGLFASQIRAIRPPEPYKGKGIRYEGEIIRRKVGKTGK